MKILAFDSKILCKVNLTLKQTWAKFPLDRWMREDGFDAEGPWPILRRMDNAKVASISSKTRPFGLSMPILGGTGRYVVRASRT